MIPLDTLRRMPLFAELPESRLPWLCDSVTDLEFAAGEILAAEGEAGKGFFILLDGEIRVTKRSSGHDLDVGRHTPPSFFGETPLLAELPLPVTLTSVGPSRLVRLDDQAFRELLSCCPSFRRIIFRTMAMRLTGLESQMQQREKMASLGTLAAGLAHELNNPAAAVSRATDRMRETLETVQALTCGLHRSGCTVEDMTALDALRVAAQSRAGTASPHDPLRAGELEDALAAWLSARGVAKPWLLAPVLAMAGLRGEELDDLATRLDSAALVTGLEWLAASVEMAALLDEAERGSARISGLVKAMKSYAYMDQGPQQEVDVHDGIEDTLTILRHRLKHGITVIRDYDRSLPRLCVYGSELNQVWTNLIDNAVDALGGRGTITVRTRRDGDHAVVEIADDGPGIPRELQARIFEPFFTSKGVGQGTGLGLDISYRIVVNRHNGDIRVRSVPGETRFRVSLPLRMPQRRQGPGPAAADGVVA